jgi:hypothetical protein
LELLSILWKARDKPRAAYREWLQRILANMVLYMKAIQPKHFEDGTSGVSNQEIDLNLAFDFVFNAVDSAKLDRLTFKDISGESLGLALSKVELMFKLLRYAIRGEPAVRA